MSTATVPTRPGPVRPRRTYAWRWVTAFVAVTIVHGLAGEWFERHRGVPPPVAAVHVPVQVALLKPERIEREARPGSPSAHAPKPAPRPVHHKAPEPHTLHAITPPRPHASLPAEQPATSPAAEASDAAATDTSTPPSLNQNGNANAAPGDGNTPSAALANASHGVKFSIPPSGDLQYDTFYNGVRNQPGTIHWMSDGARYEMVVSVPLPFVGMFSWTSRGRVDAFGLAPDKYIEKRGRRPEDVTHFNRSDKQIEFTRTPASLALPDAAQDRFSMVMQLASLVRGDPDAYQPGVTREFYVADNDSAETWPVTTIGDETVQTRHGYLTARHFMRLPRREGDKRRIDVWLAPSLGWLPVRLVQTEPNGTEFELLWRGAVTPPASNETGGTSTAGNGANAAAPAIEAAPSSETGAASSGDVTSVPSASPASVTTVTGSQSSSPPAITPQPATLPTAPSPTFASPNAIPGMSDAIKP
ncbi:DUF3108 domain-containing protein [Paraburkholderia dinghuensis]|uniref:DUF3108 domain-containing protein n=1 Tax=Paraburkholderia dinghuensis TaxID=2305225 RepID=A0A3N6MMH0_9BURK|nr:DUF3108 domain-containing protein [Paraburkholderia dinghuensis]RQH04698.1 DUF3108 domain-containing protein [Paraburkholderia dinghuensis]